MINIKGLDKAKVLVELYNHSHQLGIGMLQNAKNLTLEDARELLKNETYFDYLYGKVMKIDLSSDEEFDEKLYDLNNGAGTAQKIIDKLRKELEISIKSGDITILENTNVEYNNKQQRPSEEVSFENSDESNKISNPTVGIWKKSRRYGKIGQKELEAFEKLINLPETQKLLELGISSSEIFSNDILIYYTKDENNEYTVPRVAIVLEPQYYYSNVKVHGIATNQNLSEKMDYISIIEQKLKEFSDSYKYNDNISDMRKITNIYDKYKNGEELNVEDLKFLYEVDSYIRSLRGDEEKIITELKSRRDIRKDLAKIFSCNEDEISLTPKELLEGNKKVHYGNIEINDITNSEDLAWPEIVVGHVEIKNMTAMNNFEFACKKVNYTLWLDTLYSAEEVRLPEIVNGDLNLINLVNIKKMTFPNVLNGTLYLNSLQSAEDLILPKVMNGKLILEHLTNIDNLILPEVMNGNLILLNLVNAQNIVCPKQMSGDINLNSLQSAQGLILPNELDGGIGLRNLVSPEGIILPKDETGDFYVPGNRLICPFSEQQLIEAAKRTESYQQAPQIFENLDSGLKL